MILGVRRAGVTTTLASLEETGAVTKARGAVEISNRAILEEKTCECYRIIASEYKRLTNSGHYEHTVDEAVPAVGHLSQVGCTA
jgi:hypothetical protein